MKVEEFKRLRDFIFNLEENQINMKDWTDGKSPPCMTAGCVAGWACHLFHEQGLRLVKSMIGGYAPFYRNHDCAYGGYDAFASFFDISIFDTNHICNPRSYSGKIKKEEIIRRLDILLSNPNTGFSTEERL